MVDTDRFLPAKKANNREKKRIVHLSCFTDNHKNISGILRVVKRLSESRTDFECILIGDGEDMDMLQESVERNWIYLGSIFTLLA